MIPYDSWDMYIHFDQLIITYQHKSCWKQWWMAWVPLLVERFNLCEMTAGSWQSFHFSTFIIQGWSDLPTTHAPPPQGPFGWQKLSAASRLPFVRCVSEHLHLAPLPVITKCTRYTCLHQVHNSCVYQFSGSYRIRPHIHQGIIFTCTNCSLLEYEAVDKLVVNCTTRALKSQSFNSDYWKGLTRTIQCSVLMLKWQTIVD